LALPLVGKQLAKHISQPFRTVAQSVEQRNIANIGYAGFAGEAGHTAKRHLARTIQQRKMKQVGCTANTAPPDQRLVLTCARIKVDML
jgi:hypothetical protein